MSKLKARRIITILGVIVLVIGGYVGWQIYRGQQMAAQYTADAQKQAQGSSIGSTSSNSSALGSQEISSSPGSSNQASSSQEAPSQNPPSEAPGSSEIQPNSSFPALPSNPSSSEDYKKLMAQTYQQTLETMQNVKVNTLALQGKKLSLSAYKASIVQSQATFAAAEAYVRATPPKEEQLNPSYQEFLAGISLANQSMSVVLNGISSFSPSNIYAAREMGITALKQVTSGYAHLK